MNELTDRELKLTREAVRDRIDLRQRYVQLPAESDGMKRKQARMRNEQPILESAHAKLLAAIKERRK